VTRFLRYQSSAGHSAREEQQTRQVAIDRNFSNDKSLVRRIYRDSLEIRFKSVIILFFSSVFVKEPKVHFSPVHLSVSQKVTLVIHYNRIISRVYNVSLSR